MLLQDVGESGGEEGSSKDSKSLQTKQQQEVVQ